MLAGISHQPFKLFRKINECGHFFVVAVHARKFVRLFERLVEGHANFKRHLLCDSIDETVGLTQDSTGITNYSLRRHGAKRDDLGDAAATITFRYVVDDPVTPLHAEVDVKVRH